MLTFKEKLSAAKATSLWLRKSFRRKKPAAAAPIFSGEAAVRTANGEIFLKTGDAVTFPCGPEGAHVIRNASKTEKLVYLDFGTVNIPEIVHLPDINKIMVNGPFGKGTYDVK